MDSESCFNHLLSSFLQRNIRIPFNLVIFTQNFETMSIITIPFHWVVIDVATNTALVDTINERRRTSIQKFEEVYVQNWNKVKTKKYRCIKVNIELQEVK